MYSDASSSTVRLNIGGKKFCTTVDTLTRREPHSMLAAMFSGRHAVRKDSEKDYVFIDRDGKHFRHILNWLRDGVSYIPDLSDLDRLELLHEAEYYQLPGLVDKINEVVHKKEGVERMDTDLTRIDIIKYRMKLSGKLNLSGVNLSGLDLSKLNLSPVDLSFACLKNVNFSDASLDNCDVFGADLKSANLQRAHLEGANFENANLEGANLKDANLENANLKGTNFEGANLEGALINGANLKNANLQNANLRCVVGLKFAELDGANLRGAIRGV